MGQRDDIHGMYPETFHLEPGVTLIIPPLPGQNSLVLKPISGGSLSILGASFYYGITLPVIADQSYTVDSNEIININCSGYFTLIANGSTAVFSLLRGRTAGF